MNNAEQTRNLRFRSICHYWGKVTGAVAQYEPPKNTIMDQVEYVKNVYRQAVNRRSSNYKVKELINACESFLRAYSIENGYTETKN